MSLLRLFKWPVLARIIGLNFHNPLFGVESGTDTNPIMIYYEYDSTGRLMVKRGIVCIILFLSVFGLMGQGLNQFNGQNENYIVTNTVQVKNVATADAVKDLTRTGNAQAIQYFDGLGRPIQIVTTQGSPSGKDIVQPIVYDAYGREVRKYLPVVPDTQDGLYKPGIINAGGNYAGAAATNSYNNGPGDKVEDSPQPYAETILETSPLDRVLKQGAPGTDWQPVTTSTYDAPGADHSIKKAYTYNVADEVILFDYDETNKRLEIDSRKYYDVNQLHVNKTKDEQQHEVIEYIDKDGHTILKKVETLENGIKTFAETYYIYDDLGDLVMVLPPEATKRLKKILIP